MFLCVHVHRRTHTEMEGGPACVYHFYEPIQFGKEIQIFVERIITINR